MNKQQIIQQLQQNHFAFIDYIESMDTREFMYQHANKWTAGQQLQHINLSVRPLALALFLPKFVIRIIAGKANRPSRSYEHIVNKYKQQIAGGAKASAPYTPKTVAYSQKDSLIKMLRLVLERLVKNIESFTEEQLDYYILPHPLLGKVTVREMLYFTIHHVQHHQTSIKAMLS